MRIRTMLGITAGGLFAAGVVQASLVTQCPRQDPGACARVHALLTQGRPPLGRPAPVVVPLHAHEDVVPRPMLARRPMAWSAAVAAG